MIVSSTFSEKVEGCPLLRTPGQDRLFYVTLQYTLKPFSTRKSLFSFFVGILYLGKGYVYELFFRTIVEGEGGGRKTTLTSELWTSPTTEKYSTPLFVLLL